MEEEKIINYLNEIKGAIRLNPDIFCLKSRFDILKQVYDWQMFRRHIGTHQSKGISDVSGTTAKPYQQKHTGRARQGSLRSPQFKGGAIIFGPKNKVGSFSLNKKVRILGLKIALSLKKSNNQLLIIDDAGHNFVKTNQLSKSFANFKYSSFMVVGNYNQETKRLYKNLRNVKLVDLVGINVVDILSYDCLVLTVSAVKYLEGRLL